MNSISHETNVSMKESISMLVSVAKKLRVSVTFIGVIGIQYLKNGIMYQKTLDNIAIIECIFIV